MRFLTFLLCLMTVSGFSQKKNAFAPSDLQIDWRLIQNNFEGKDQFRFSFTLTNMGKKSLPAAGWTIYYNANRDIVNKQLMGPLESFRWHGDLFYLKPVEGFNELKPGESITVDGVGSAWAFNIADAPSGYYWVWDDQPAVAYAISKIRAYPPSNIHACDD